MSQWKLNRKTRQPFQTSPDKGRCSYCHRISRTEGHAKNCPRLSLRTTTAEPVFRTRPHQTLGEIFGDLAFKGNYLEQTKWLRDHKFAYFEERITPDDYIWETWMDNSGNVVRIKISRPSDVGMEKATIVDSEYIPAPVY
jgi:hypothetical protein